jgi:putative acetyltransferase
MQAEYRDFLIRSWQPADRAAAAQVIQTVLAEYGLGWESCCGANADLDAVEVERFYWATRGQFWVVERADQIIGTAGYYPIQRGNRAVEIRKMYLLPECRGQGLGRFLLQQLEATAAAQGFQEIWLETASVLKTAVRLYEQQGYLLETGSETAVETPRCDRVYRKPIAPLLAPQPKDFL